MMKDAILTKSDVTDPEIGPSFLFTWLSKEISQQRAIAEQATMRADKLASLMASACTEGKWCNVRTIKLVTDQAYVIRRPGSSAMELSIWNDGWRALAGHLDRGGELEVWIPTERAAPASFERQDLDAFEYYGERRIAELE